MVHVGQVALNRVVDVGGDAIFQLAAERGSALADFRILGDDTSGLHKYLAR